MSNDLVLVPRDFVHWLRNVALCEAEETDSKREKEERLTAAAALQARLDAPLPRVVQDGDVIIPASVICIGGPNLYENESTGIWCAEIDGKLCSGVTPQAAVDALAKALGETQ